MALDTAPTTRPSSAALSRWWPVGAFLAVTVAVQVAWLGQFDATAHAAGHLGSATAAFPMAFALTVLVWALPKPARRDPLLWLALAVVSAGTLVMAAGNLEVVDAIGQEAWSDEEAAALGASRPGFEDGHESSERGALVAVLGTVVLALVLWQRRLVTGKVAAGAAVLSVLFPYWVFPGLGVAVLAVSLARARSRRLRWRAGDLRPYEPSATALHDGARSGSTSGQE